MRGKEYKLETALMSERKWCFGKMDLMFTDDDCNSCKLKTTSECYGVSFGDFMGKEKGGD